MNNKYILKRFKYKNYMKNQFAEIDVDAEHLENAFEDKQYYKAMKQVPIIQKRILYLVEVCGYSYKQVARMLNIKVKKVIKLKKQAIRNFRENLKKEGLYGRK